MKYQPEVDGLRALAVLPVLLFHAQVAGFSGGFVGVDVFFVISGYLITGILQQDLDSGRFSIIHFYERRVRRIIPAIMALIAFTLVAGAILFLPYQLTDLSFSAINAVTFTSNVWFWRETGYFAGTTALQPLLHTWSLAVEEQFYVVFPVALYALHRLRLKFAGIAAAWVLSFIAAAILVYRMPSAAFYLIPTRAWELATGSILALGAVPAITNRPVREWVAIGGVLMILLPVYLYTEKTEFPGLAALPPCLGTFLLILAARSGPNAVSTALSRKEAVGIGLISYSLYLWHWPLLVFARQWSGGDLGPAVTAGCLAASFVAAWLSWRFIERPFRDRTRFTRKQVFRYGGAAMAVVGLSAILLSGGLPGRLNPRARMLADGHHDRPATVASCLGAGPLFSCRLGSGDSPTFAVWGDSHAAALGDAISSVARAVGRSGKLFAFNACPPGSPPSNPHLAGRDRSDCLARNRLVEQALAEDPSLSTIVLVAYWQNYPDPARRAMLAELQGLTRRLCLTGKSVVVTVDHPAPGFDVPLRSALAERFNQSSGQSFPAPRPDPQLREVLEQSGARTISLSGIMCSAGRCSAVTGDRPLYFDDNHFSRASTARLARGLGEAGLFTPSPACRKP